MRSLLIVLLLSSAARADSTEDPDTEIARKHFAEGTALYAAGRYADAVWEFEAAYAVRPEPLLSFNIARCRDRLEEWDKAVAAYERYVAAIPNALDIYEVRERIAVLRDRVKVPAGVGGVIPPKSTIDTNVGRVAPNGGRIGAFRAPIALGAISLTLASVGAGLLGSAAADYSGLERACAPSCARGQWSGLPGREYTGEAFLGAAAVVAVVDVVLWVRARRGR